MKRAVLVVMPGGPQPDKQTKILLAYCAATPLQVVSVLHGDPQAAVPLLPRLVDVIVVACADSSGMANLAELAAMAAGGELRYVRRSKAQTNRLQRDIDPMIARMLDRNMKPETIAEIVGVPVDVVYETIILSGRQLSARDSARRPANVTGRTVQLRARVVG